MFRQALVHHVLARCAGLGLAALFTAGMLTCAAADEQQSAVAAAPSGAIPPIARPSTQHPKPVLEFLVNYTTMTGGDEIASKAPPGNPFVNNDLRASVRFSDEFAKRLVFTYFHNTVAADTTLGRVADRTNKWVYPASSRDTADDYSITYFLRSNPQASSSVYGYLKSGYFYRYRVCCPATADPNNLTPAAQRVYYTEAQYRTRKFTPQRFQFSYTVRGSDAVHKTTPTYLSRLPAGYSDRNRMMPGLSETLYGEMSPDYGHSMIAFTSFTWGAQDFYDNTPFPYAYDTFAYGLQKVVSKSFTIRGEVSQQTQRLQGYPFVMPNAIHRAKLVLTGIYRVSP